LKDKLSEENKESLLDAIKESKEWLDKNQNADKEEYEEELRELEKTC
jgi:molecular chaperone DnaK (HSP70)